MNTVTNIIKIADEEWPPPLHFIAAFCVGLIAYFILNRIVRSVMKALHRKAGTTSNPAAEKGKPFSETFALVEQFLFYLAAVAGLQIFGFAVGGWLVMKSVCRYALWKPSDETQRESAHNRFLIFILGTGMSIASGGIAGVAYHYSLYILSRTGCAILQM
jgi:hypothetical protein